ncbi:MAG: type II secretion system F family protein [Planctomycetota bacterium]|nr:type II secretion system F family protein [Planctomycetota bacterium]
MPLFEYTAMDSAGAKAAGSMPAANRSAALAELQGKGLIPVTVRELSHLLAGGVSLSRALHILGREAAQPAARRQWQAIHDDVVGGMPLGEAMGKWPRSFPPVQVAMVRAGEAGGFLDVVLAQIAEFRSRERDLKSKVKSALAYPIILCVLAVGVLIFLMTYFIPRFSLIFADFGQALPALTRAIVQVSQFVTRYGLFLAIFAIAGFVLLRRAAQSHRGRRVMEKLLLRTPGVGSVLARFALVRFCRMLGTLLGAGVAMVAALKVARDAIGNQTLADAVTDSIDQVQRGAPLSRSLAACGALFPPSVAEIIAVAEESGRLDEELVRLAGSNEQELDRRLRVLVAMAEPALLFVMAAIVGLVVIGMLLPVFTLQELIH